MVVLKMIILDDERMERTYMKKFIDWSSLGIEIAGEASNGVDGLLLCEKIKPDIIMTDIKMPEMDGMEFSKKAKEMLPDVKIVFVSGYGDFDNARTAVDLNAFGYILKPFRVENVVEVLKNVTSRCNEEVKRNQEREKLKEILERNRGILKESLIREILDGGAINQGIWERVDFLGIRLKPGQYCVMLVEVDQYEELIASLHQEDRQLLTVNLLQTLDRALNRNGSGEVIKINEKQFAAIISLPDNTDGEFNNVYSIAEIMKSEVLSKIKVSVTIGVSTLLNDITSLNYLFQQACDAVKYKVFDMKGQIIGFNDFQLSAGKKEIDLKKIDLELIEYLRMGNQSKINDALDQVFNGMVIDRNISSGFIQNTCISIVCTGLRYLNEINCTFKDVLEDDTLIWQKLMKLETIADIKQWMKNVFAAILEAVNSKKLSKNRMLVQKVIELIHEKYNMDLTTKEVAKEIFLSPNYIGSLFKEETGLGFLEYLTKVRMEKAVEMLQDPNMKIYEVAQLVGYNNVPYFSTLFKDFTGVTPSEYRKTS